MPTRNGDAFLDRVLTALAQQEVSLPWDFLAIDSGSTDRTLAILGDWQPRFPVPLRVRHIHPSAFDHGDTRNLLAAESTGDLLVFLTQDAIPRDAAWLETLLRNFADPRVGAAYCRNVPRPDANILTRVFSEHDPGYATGRREHTLPPVADYARMSPHDKRLLFNMNDVASAIRRTVWERHPFPRTEFGEDVLMARALIEAGHVVVYDAAAAVEHSHDYLPTQMRERAQVDGQFNVEWLDRVCVKSRSEARALTARQLKRDRQALDDAGVTGPALDAHLTLAEGLREAAFMGLYEGGRSTRRHRATRMLGRSTLRVLFVVHGFPPDTWAGTEVYTLGLAQAMQRRGHEVHVLTRAPAAREVADGGPEDFSLARAEFQGLPVWRMSHRLRHQRLRDTYDQPRAEAAFREVLRDVNPDVVHFQHLIHLSARLPLVCRELGLASLITVNDYWALCARVQFIRPDAVRCDENQGLGCLVCVKGTALDRIDAARRFLPALRPLAPIVNLSRALPALTRVADAARELQDIADRHAFVCAGYAACDLQIAPSRFLRQKLLDTGRFDPHTVLYSDYGTITDRVRPIARTADPGGRIRFGFIGSLLWYKGIDLLIRAMRELDPSKAVLNIHGDFTPDRDPFHHQLAELAAASAGAVAFHGRFDNQDIARVYEGIDVLVVPSIWFENSPITIHESFLFRTPVVVSNIGGMAELVRDGVDGLHFEAGNAADLAGRLARFVQEPGLAAALGDFPPVKTIDEDAREMEVRYRALACIVRSGT